MDTDLWIRWAFVVGIMAVSVGGITYGLYLLAFIASSLAERILSLFFLSLVMINGVFNSVGCYYYLRSYGLDTFEPKRLEGFPKVAVLVPCRNEDAEMVKRNLRSLAKLDYPKDRFGIHLIDNSTAPEKALEAECRKLGITYRFMENPPKYKAYVLNEYLKSLNEEYIAIFDADECLADPSFLRESLAELQADPKAGFVQTIKEFAPGSFFANAVNVYYLFFYRFMQTVRHRCRSPMFCGSCGIVRKSVVQKVGGFPYSPTEDLWFALKADLAGNGGVFAFKRYAYGAPIENFSDFLSQQWRYTIGNVWTFYEYLSNLGRLSAEKHIHYISQVCGYLYLSVLFILYALLSVAFVLYDISMRSLNSQVVVPDHLKLVAVSYIIAIVLLVVVGGRLYFGSFRLGLLAFFLNFASAMVRAKAIIVGALRIPAKFVITRQAGKRLTIIGALRLTMLESLFAVFLFAFAVISFLRSDAISAFWLFWYAWLFSCAFLFALATEVFRDPVKQGVFECS
ncbi:MAG: glycosyltransferase family 2 protein [Candidatus ainarchaeum sp.]|nr:glycosyltransferase family 2 protein [Candidatus ainarchaeum sp.]